MSKSGLLGKSYDWLKKSLFTFSANQYAFLTKRQVKIAEYSPSSYLQFYYM